jgi:hypothetical protein
MQLSSCWCLGVLRRCSARRLYRTSSQVAAASVRRVGGCGARRCGGCCAYFANFMLWLCCRVRCVERCGAGGARVCHRSCGDVFGGLTARGCCPAGAPLQDKAECASGEGDFVEPPKPEPVTLNGVTYPPLADANYDVIICGTGLTVRHGLLLACSASLSHLHRSRWRWGSFRRWWRVAPTVGVFLCSRCRSAASLVCWR